MDSVDRPTQQQLLEIARDPEAAKAAVERWGIDALMNPHSDHPQKGVGLGDAIAKVTSAAGIRPCGPCQQRRRKLNRWRLGG